MQGILVTVFLFFPNPNCLSLFAELLGSNSCSKIRQSVKEEIICSSCYPDGIQNIPCSSVSYIFSHGITKKNK